MFSMTTNANTGVSTLMVRDDSSGRSISVTSRHAHWDAIYINAVAGFEEKAIRLFDEAKENAKHSVSTEDLLLEALAAGDEDDMFS